MPQLGARTAILIGGATMPDISAAFCGLLLNRQQRHLNESDGNLPYQTHRPSCSWASSPLQPLGIIFIPSPVGAYWRTYPTSRTSGT
ncbi:hypothetical protein DFH09DRAFT_463483 [Mycena vulgaris]|nr:hypothetical protein DFH09DRAFT_463483 [Mycena vulgaris]